MSQHQGHTIETGDQVTVHWRRPRYGALGTVTATGLGTVEVTVKYTVAMDEIVSVYRDGGDETVSDPRPTPTN